MSHAMPLVAAHRCGLAFGDAHPDALTIAALGGAPPSKVLLFPAGRWVLADDVLITDEEAFRQVIANFREREIAVVFDYEHMTLDEFRKAGELPIAAGFIVALEVTPAGLVGVVEWTDKAAQHIAAGEYRYHSPVAIYDKTSKRVIALHSCALTNTPRTNKQRPITEQVAAKIIDAYYAANQKGGRGVEWTELLMQFLAGDAASSPDEKIASLEALIESLRTGGTAAASTGTIYSAIGLALASDVPPAAQEVIAALGLDPGANTGQLVARIGEMKTRRVAKAEHERVVAAVRAELETERQTVASLRSQLDEVTSGTSIEALIAANLDGLSPALRENIRNVAKSNRALAVEMIANITGKKGRKLGSPGNNRRQWGAAGHRACHTNTPLAWAGVGVIRRIGNDCGGRACHSSRRKLRLRRGNAAIPQTARHSSVVSASDGMEAPQKLHAKL